MSTPSYQRTFISNVVNVSKLSNVSHPYIFYVYAKNYEIQGIEKRTNKNLERKTLLRTTINKEKLEAGNIKRK